MSEGDDIFEKNIPGRGTVDAKIPRREFKVLVCLRNLEKFRVAGVGEDRE